MGLAGGFIEWGETAEEACRRELSEETGVLVRDLRLVGVYSAPDRDPRGHVCSIAFMAEVGEASTKAGDEVAGLEWWSDWSGLDLAFDHRDILADAVRLARHLSRTPDVPDR